MSNAYFKECYFYYRLIKYLCLPGFWMFNTLHIEFHGILKLSIIDKCFLGGMVKYPPAKQEMGV